MTTTYKTLKELNVKAGDVVQYIYSDKTYTVHKNETLEHLDGTIRSYMFWDGAKGFKIVSRSDEPTIFRHMTDAEKGALLLAKHEGKVIEYYGLPPGEWFADFEFAPQEYPDIAYRVAEPEPRRLTVDLMADFKVIGTIDLIDGKPDPDSIKMDEI